MGMYSFNQQKIIKGVSLFSGAGIGETFLSDIGIDIVVANELVKKRADLYKSLYTNRDIICGDITDESVFGRILSLSKEREVEFLLASPPCQGLSVAGKNRKQNQVENDSRNYLISYVIDLIKLIKPKYILIENVPMLLKMKILFGGKLKSVPEILNNNFSGEYRIEYDTLNSANYGVPQTRKRAIIKMCLKTLTWNSPKVEPKVITVKDAIGHLPSLESGEISEIKWHYARKHTDDNIRWMKHTPTGCTAFNNEIHFPQKKDGTRIKGYESSYRRIRWDAPAPTITTRSDCIASQRNVHPGRLKSDGTYSDSRVLTPLELMILNSLPHNWNIPKDTPELLIRQCIGESIPPLMLKKILEGVTHEN